MVTGAIYSVVRLLIDLIDITRADQARLQVEVLALRRQVQVLERQVKRVRWQTGDKLVLAALMRRLAPEAWSGLLVKPETVIGLVWPPHARPGIRESGNVDQFLLSLLVLNWREHIECAVPSLSIVKDLEVFEELAG